MNKKNKKRLWKVFSWQTISTLVAIAYTAWWIGDIKGSVALILTELIILAILYYVHERFWGD